MFHHMIHAGRQAARLTAALSGAAEPAKLPKPDPVQLCLDRFEKISELVLDNHLDPPTRQEMFLGGVRALLAQAQATVPDDLSRRVSRLSSQDQFAAFLKDNWPKPAADTAA